MSETGTRLTPRYERIVKYLTDNPGKTSTEICEAIHCSRRNAQLLIAKLHTSQEIHIGGWKRQTGLGGGHIVAKWSAGPGETAKKPKFRTPTENQRNRINRLKKAYGEETARKIISPRTEQGLDVISRDGVVIYRRGAPRGKHKQRQQATA